MSEEQNPPQGAQPPAPVSTPTFFDRLPEYFQNHEIVGAFRLAKEGVFVAESMLDSLLEAYQRWTKEAAGTGEGKSLEKIRRRLFGEGSIPLYYVLDGKRCLAGFIIRGEKPDPRRSRIPVYQANLLPTLDDIHPRDPYLQSVPAFSMRMTPHEGFVMEVLREGKKLDVSEDALRDFAAAVRSSPQLSAKYPDARRALRFALRPLVELLAEAREVPENQRMLLPSRLRGKSGLKFLRSRALTFVVASEKKLAGCFLTKGKSLSPFIKREITEMVKAGKEASPRGFSPESQKKHCVGRTWSQSIAFHLNSRALIQFLKQLERSPRTRKKLPSHYTTYDVLERFVSLFRNSKPIDERELLGKLRRREAFAKYRRTGSWIFVILDKNVISSCVILKSLSDKDGS